MSMTDRHSHRCNPSFDPHSAKVKVLAVDDQPQNLVALERMLESMPVELVKAGSGEDALKRLLEDDFALILMDVQMPGLNGFETTALIRQRDRSRHVPVVFLTAAYKSDMPMKGYALGAVDYLLKPSHQLPFAGRPARLVLAHDITERKIIEAQLLRTQRMESIGTLAGGIAHDLNNVLSPILMSVELLKARFTDDVSQRVLDTVEISAKRGADIVRQVLTFARGVEGEQKAIQPARLL